MDAYRISPNTDRHAPWRLAGHAVRMMTPPRDEPGSGAERSREDRELFIRYGEGDELAREQLVERFLPLARQLARRYQRAGEPLDDLMQVASMGLIKAIDRFDPEREIAFSSYAVPTILGEIKRHFRDRTWAVRVPRDLQELTLRVDKAVGELSEELRRQPSVAEIGAAVGADEEQVLEALQAGGAYRAVSFDAPRGGAARRRGRDARRLGRRRRGRLRPRRGARDARAPPDDRDAARARRAAHALRGGHDAGGDRRRHRREPDAGLARHPPGARAPAGAPPAPTRTRTRRPRGERATFGKRPAGAST